MKALREAYPLIFAGLLSMSSSTLGASDVERGEEATPQAKESKTLPTGEDDRHHQNDHADPPDPNGNAAVSVKPSVTVIESARATLVSTGVGNARGIVVFEPAPDPAFMRVKVDLRGLSPGLHGLHIHQYGDCSDGASSAGKHLNPYDANHGGPQSSEHHVGDLGNVTANKSGETNTTLSFQHLTFKGEASIIGKAVVVHAGKDDLTTSPAGRAGARIACGTILAN